MGKITVFYDDRGMVKKSPEDQPDFADISDERLKEMITSGSGIAYLVDYVTQNLGWQVLSYPQNVSSCFVVFDNKTILFHQTLCVKVEIFRNGRISVISTMNLAYDSKLLAPDSKFTSLADLNTKLEKSGWCSKNRPVTSLPGVPIRLWYTCPIRVKS